MPREPDLKYKFIKVTLLKIIDGQEWYEVRKPNDRIHTGTYFVGDDYWYDGDCHKQFITEDTVKLFVNARNDFIDKIEKAKNEQDGYKVLKVSDCCIAFKNLQQSLLYSFVLLGKTYKKVFTETVYDFLFRISGNFDADYRRLTEIEILKLKNELMSLAFTNKDLYFAYAIKENINTITQQEADYLCSVDGNYRFFPQNKIYNTEDIEILGVKNGHYSIFIRRVNFYCDVKIKDKKYRAVWYPIDIKYKTECSYISSDDDSNILCLQTYKYPRTIKISDSVREIIEKLIENR